MAGARPPSPGFEMSDWRRRILPPAPRMYWTIDAAGSGVQLMMLERPNIRLQDRQEQGQDLRLVTDLGRDRAIAFFELDQEFGIRQPIEVDDEGVIIIGHRG